LFSSLSFFLAVSVVRSIVWALQFSNNFFGLPLFLTAGIVLHFFALIEFCKFSLYGEEVRTCAKLLGRPRVDVFFFCGGSGDISYRDIKSGAVDDPGTKIK